MPRKRIQPDKRWLISRPSRRPARQLSALERDRLKKIAGLGAALPTVEKIAERFIGLASDPIPSGAEVRAALMLLGKRITALQKEIRETDIFTLYMITDNYRQILSNDNSRGVLVRHVLGIAENELNAWQGPSI